MLRGWLTAHSFCCDDASSQGQGVRGTGTRAHSTLQVSLQLKIAANMFLFGYKRAYSCNMNRRRLMAEQIGWVVARLSGYEDG